MDYLGMYCIGAFAGTFTTLVMGKITSIDDWKKALLIALPAVFTGVVVAFAGKINSSSAVGAYPVGLVVGLSWAYIADAKINISSDKIGLKIVGWGHMAASTLITLAATGLCAAPAIAQIVAELNISTQDRADLLLKAHQKDLEDSTKASVAETERSSTSPR